MNSLKAFLPYVSTALGGGPLSVAKLYERQRALVRLKVLSASPGRGPGSGVALIADNVAALIIALAATDNLSDTDERVVKLCKASPTFKKVCPFTGATTFRSALGIVLASYEKAKALEYVGVDRQDLSASIGYRVGRRSMSSPFNSPRTPSATVGITTRAMVLATSLRMTAGYLETVLSGAITLKDEET